MFSHRLVRNTGLFMMCLIIVIMGLLSFSVAVRISDYLSIVIKRERPILDKVRYISKNFQETKDIFYNFVTGEGVEGDKDRADMTMVNVINGSKDLKELFKNRNEKIANDFLTAVKRLRIAIISYLDQVRDDPAGDFVLEMEKIVDDEMEKASYFLNEISNDVNARIRATDINLIFAVKNQQKTMWVYMIFGVISGIFVAFFISRALSKQLNQLIDGMKKIAAGDMGFRVKVEGSDEIGQLASSFNNMTDRLDQSVSLLKKEKKFNENLVNTAQTIILVLREDGTILSFNPYFEEITGYRVEEMRGKDWFDNFLAKTDIKKTKQVFRDVITYESVMNNVNTVLTKEGCEIWVEWYNKALKDENNNIIGVLAVGQDITKRKRAEEELNKAQKATLNIMEDLREAYDELKNTQEKLVQSEKMEAIGRMASAVAHEVKNPLGIVLQGIDYLEEEIPELQKDKREMLVMMKESVKRADSIVRTLLDFSRYEKIEIKAEDINSTIERSLGFVGQKIKLNNLEVFREFGKDMPKIAADQGKIEQILINLFNNAIDSMPGGGKLYVRSYLTKFDEPGDSVGNRKDDIFKIGEQIVAVEIEDTGAGMDEDTIKKLFDPFFTTKKRGEGTGLGLAVVKNIISLHGGLISVESNPGRGTKFLLRFKLFTGG